MTTWNELLTRYMQTEIGKQLVSNYKSAIASHTISPCPAQTFRAYSESICSFEDTKIVLLFDEPCADPAIADGLAFSSKKEGHILPETKILYNWMKKGCFPYLTVEQFKEEYVSENLYHWAKQGILLVNTKLCVLSGRPGTCNDMEWDKFTAWMLAEIAYIKAEENKPILFVFIGSNKPQFISWLSPIHQLVRCENPLETVKGHELSMVAKSLFVGMSNFVSEHYPNKDQIYDCSLEKAFDFDKVDQLWMDHVISNRIPMPAMPEGISGKLKQSILNLSSKFDCPGTAGVVLTPSINYRMGINFQKTKK